MTARAPDVSVLMPVRSPAPFLAEAVRSVVDQSHPSWELVLVNDGADPEVLAVTARLVPDDRLVYVPIGQPRGLSFALNQGLAHCRGDLVARLDGDDRARPERLAHQIEFLNEHPEVVLVGSGARVIDTVGRLIGRRPVRTERVRELLLARNQLIHSSVAFRRRDVEAVFGYALTCHLREDYELWLRLAARGEVANLDELLVDYRVSPGQVSRRLPEPSALNMVWAAQRDLARTLSSSAPWALVRRVTWRATQGRWARLIAPGDAVSGRAGCWRRSSPSHQDLRMPAS